MKFFSRHPESDASNEACAVCARDSGCGDCFDALIGRLQVPLIHHLLQRVGNRHDAEDILQETWLLAYRNIGKYNAAYRFTTWIFTILHRQAISAARTAKSARPDLLELANADSQVPAPGCDPHEAANQAEQKQSLWSQIREILDTDAFTALWLTYVEGMTADEVGAVLDRNGNGVRILLTRSRAKLAEQLPQHCRFEGTTP